MKVAAFFPKVFYRCCVPLILALGKERQVCVSLRPAWFTHQVSGHQGYIRELCPLQKLLHLFVGEQGKHVEVRITFRSLFSLSTMLRPVLNSDSQTWQQVPSTSEPSHWPRLPVSCLLGSALGCIHSACAFLPCSLKQENSTQLSSFPGRSNRFL